MFVCLRTLVATPSIHESACLVFPDADLVAMASSMVGTETRNAGQVWSAVTRIVAHEQIVAPLLDRVRTVMAGITIGPGLQDLMLGPVVSDVQMDRVLELIDDGRRAGAVVVTGGGRAAGAGLESGYFVAPTVFASVRPDIRIAQVEIFGPVIATLSFDAESDAVEIANGTDDGLAAGVYTKDVDRALRVSQRLEAGQVFVNRYLAGGVETPFGGYKGSGWGREKGLPHWRTTPSCGPLSSASTPRSAEDLSGSASSTKGAVIGSSHEAFDRDIVQARFEAAPAEQDPRFEHFFLFQMFGLSVSYGPETCRVEIPVDGSMYNPQGSLHGDVIVLVLDVLMGHLLRHEQKQGMTVGLHTNFLRPVTGPAYAEARLLRAGRRVAHVTSEMFDAEDRLCASATATFLRVEPQA